MIALKPANFEGFVFSVLKKILLINISNARNIFIRIPLKLAILVLALLLKLVFGPLQSVTAKSCETTKEPEPVKHSNTKPTRQSSPSSISVVLSTVSDDMSVQRKSVSSKLDFGTNKTSTYSLVKSVSKSSMVNFFTPDYTFNGCYDKDSLNGFSDINSVKTMNTESIKKELLLNETELDCDSLESSFYFDLKTHFSEKNLINSSFGDHFNSEQKSKMHDVSGSADHGLPDLINQKRSKDVSTDKARKYLEGMDGVKFNEVQVPDTLKKQLEYFDRDELLQLIAYQKKYLDFKETRIKDLENYIDNLVVKIIETEPLILMNATSVLSKSKNVI